MAYEHVTDYGTRRILENKWDGDLIQLLMAIDYAKICLTNDIYNEDVTDDVYVARLKHWQDARFAYSTSKDDEAIEHLRQFWSV